MAEISSKQSLSILLTKALPKDPGPPVIKIDLLFSIIFLQYNNYHI